MASGIFSQRNINRLRTLGGLPAVAPPSVEYLLVAGGGPGAKIMGFGGGGGAGGVLQGVLPVSPSVLYTATVGAGGADSNPPQRGGNSIFGTVTAIGGGQGMESGAITLYDNYNGGSGGGGASGTYNSNQGGKGTVNQGNNGGRGAPGPSSPYGTGGGGGAGSPGIPALSDAVKAGNGGTGVASRISGTSVMYGGGGGGFIAAGQTAGTGGAGGGGNGANDYSNASTAGTVNTGGGGGAGGSGSYGSSGGSGIVIVSYPDVYANAVSQTNATYSTSGSGSMYFNNAAGASNQAVTYSNATATTIGANDFCIEAFVWWSSNSGAAPYVATNYSGSTNYYWGLYQQTTLQFYVYGGVYLNSGSFTNDAWNHVVVCRTSGTTSMFLNGTRTATASDSVTYASSSTVYVGQNNIGTNFLNGYLSNFRIVVGNSIYNASASSITVPIAPFAGTSQTKMLLSSISPNAYLDSSSSALTPTLVSNTGSVTWNQFSPFTTTGYKNRVYKWTSSGTITF